MTSEYTANSGSRETSPSQNQPYEKGLRTTSNMTPSRQTLLDIAIAFSKSYDEWTVEGALRIRTPDCIHQVHPASLKRPAMSNNDYAAYLESINKLFQNYRVYVYDDKTLVDVDNRTVIMQARGTADTILGPFSIEYLFILEVDKCGHKIQKIDEFVDSAAVVGLVPRIKEEWAKASS